MKDTVKKALEALAQSRGIDTSKYSDDYVLFQDLTGITSATDEFIEETLNADWYVPGGIVRPDEANSANSTDPKPEPTPLKIDKSTKYVNISKYFDITYKTYKHQLHPNL